MTNQWGEKRKILLVDPENTTGQHTGVIAQTLKTYFSTLGSFDLKTAPFSLDALTLEKLRVALIRTKADVLVFTYIKQRSITCYLFDRMSPYFLFAAMENLPKDIATISQKEIEGYSRQVLRQILFAYVEHDYFILPRQETPNVLKRPIPEWMLSSGTLLRINHERAGRFLISFGLGGAMIKGGLTSSYWNSNVLNMELGFRMLPSLYLETSYSAFTYHLFSGLLRYRFSTRDNPLLLSASLGGAYLSDKMTLNTDETFAFGQATPFVLAGVQAEYPVIDVHFKLEAQMLASLKRPGSIFMLLTGIVAYF